jgi:hypothetical protein
MKLIRQIVLTVTWTELKSSKCGFSRHAGRSQLAPSAFATTLDATQPIAGMGYGDCVGFRWSYRKR